MVGHHAYKNYNFVEIILFEFVLILNSSSLDPNTLATKDKVDTYIL